MKTITCKTPTAMKMAEVMKMEQAMRSLIPVTVKSGLM